MADIEIHTANGWKKLGDIMQGQETCDKCGIVEGAEGDGYQKCEPEMIIYFCRECRKSHG